ncbi:MAG TPA: hypothetical protein VLU73_04240, partial [Methylococcaceae bacterium]|nr:hypothetical protein [Methylococcaceae bacterium]
MRRDSFLDSGTGAGLADCLPHDLLRYRLVGTRVVHRAWKQVGFRAHPPVIFAQCCKQVLTQRDLTVDAALALYDAHHHALAVYVANLESAQLGTAETRRIERHQDGPMVLVAGRATQLSHFL